jgi:hypothetical protein
METDPVCGTLCFQAFRIPDDGQNSNPSNSKWYLPPSDLFRTSMFDVRSSESYEFGQPYTDRNVFVSVMFAEVLTLKCAYYSVRFLFNVRSFVGWQRSCSSSQQIMCSRMRCDHLV